jgi:RHS repeat-associated protein
MTTAVGSGYGTCGQTVPQSGLWTTYTYDTLDNLLTITQNAQAALSLRQIHTYTYDDLGRMTSEQNPETAGATYWYSYDTDPGATCPASNGDLVKRLDPANNVTCYAYDALHRTTAVTYRSGPYAASTPSKYFVYDTATVGGVTMANAAGRLAEAFTGSSSSKSTDLGFSYSTRGEVTDVYQTSPSLAGAYYHVNALYSVSGPEGLIQALSVPNPAALPSWTYNPDTEGRVGSVMAGPNNYGPMRGALAQSQSPVVSSVAYNYASQVTNVTFGSGDSDAFTYDSNTGRMTQYAASVSALPSVSIAVNGQQSSTNYYCTDSFIVTVTGAPMTPVYVNQNNGGTFQAGVTGPSGVYTASGSWNSTYVGTYTQVWSVGPTAATATAATPTLKFTVTATPPSPAGPLASVYGPGPSGELTWNANGSLAQLSIVDPLNLANNGQTCNHVYDDLGRVSQVLCVTGNWDQAFTYDPFGNIYKSQFGWYQNGTFQPTYKPGTNQYLSLPGGYYPQYDANGSLTYDVFHHYSWDAEGKLQQLDPGAAQTTLTYDALGRRVEQTNASGTIEILYGPDGSKLALMSGLTGVVKAFVPLPAGATAVYNSTGRLAWYRHSDWLGSSRISSTPTRGVYYDAAYSPYGESYDESGTADRSFTGQNQDLTPAGDLYDFSYRQYSAPQSRWISPDPAGLAAIDLTNPQSCNAYAYVGGSPLDTVDPLGLDGEINGSGPGGSAGGSIWGIFSFFLDLFTGDLGGGSSGGVQTVKKPTTPTHAPTRSKPTTPPPGSRPCGANQRRFFNWLDNSTIRGMATDLGTTPTIIFTLAAKEGGWQASDLNHNIPLQNPFGVNSINRRGQAAGNKKYLLLKDAVFDWRHNVAAAPYVHGIKDAGSFVDTLLAHGYNANRVAYRSAFMSINGSMPGHMADCGVKP